MKLKEELLIVLLLLCSCTRSVTEREEAKFQTICRLSDNIANISLPFSFSVAEDGRFVLCDNEKVFLYSSEGRQIRQIGNKGKSKYEYNHPSVVRIYKDTIYVWSSFTLRFISYTMDGEFVEEYPYLSAIGDFIPSDKYIYIYNKGKSIDNVIDVYDKRSKSIVNNLTESTPEHKTLLHKWAALPMMLSNSKLYYTSTDDLTVRTYDANDVHESDLARIESETFKVSDLDEYKYERKKTSEYLRDNSIVLSLFKGNKDKIYLLTLEGVSRIKDNKADNSERFFSVYDIFARQPLKHIYSYESIGTEKLFDNTCGNLFVLQHKIENEEDVYLLNKLIIE